MNIKRGKIFLANLDPTIGGEIRKTRPVIVISNDFNNEFNYTITIIPLTSKAKIIYPFEVFLSKGTGNLTKDSKARADHIRTIDKSRLIKEIGEISKSELENIEEAIKIHLKLS